MLVPGDEHKLIESSLNGDLSSFKILVQRYEGKVAGIVKSMLGDTPEALDVGQEVFIRFYESMRKFREEASVGTYLGRIAINLSLNELARRKKRVHLFRSIEAADDAVEESSRDDDLAVILQNEIARLEPEFKAVVTLRLIEGYSTEETAAMLGLPLGTVLSRLFRAQKKLKTALQKFKER